MPRCLFGGSQQSPRHAAPSLLGVDDESRDADEGASFGQAWDAVQGYQARAIIGHQHEVIRTERSEAAQHRLVGCRVPELTEQTSDDAGVPSASTTDHARPSIAGATSHGHATPGRALVNQSQAIRVRRRLEIPIELGVVVLGVFIRLVGILGKRADNHRPLDELAGLDAPHPFVTRFRRSA
jgi:hypothetical protein